MKRSFIITVSLTAVIVTVSAFLFAQQPGPKGKFKEARKEMRTYAEKNIVPVMKPQREKLDAVLSIAEKEEVEAIRAGLKAQHESMRALHHELRTSEGEPSAGQRDALRKAQKDGRLLMNRAWALVDAHESTIYGLLDETESQQKQWREDIRAIMEKYHGERHPGMDKPHGAEGPHGGFHGRKGPHPHGHQGTFPGGRMQGADFLMPVGFLLWDGSLPEPPQFDKAFHGEGPDGLQVFPNPIEGGSSSLRFTVDKPGVVTIVLMDEAGNQVRTLLNQQKEAGTHTEQFDLGELAPGVYYYKVQTPGQSQVKRILID